MKTRRTKFLRSLCHTSLMLTFFLPATILAATVAYDNADLANYTPQPNHNWSVINGGFGYKSWTILNDIAFGTCCDGGTYMSGFGVEFRQVEGNFSFGTYAYGTGFDISRALNTAMYAGHFSILTRFDIEGTGPNHVNLRSGNDTAGFVNSELLAFGIDGDVDNSQLSYRDGSGIHLLPSGEARGSVWQWNVDFSALLGVYTATVTNVNGGFSARFSGYLEAKHTSVGSFAVRNSSVGSFQNVIFDSPTFSIPQPPGRTTAGR